MSLVLMLLALVGCLVVPIPTPHGTVLEGSEVKQSHLAFLQQSLTTKAEITERLGTPAVFWRDENIFVYRWVHREGILIWAVGGAYAAQVGTTDISSDYAFLVKFDASDRFETSEVVKKPWGKSFGQLLLDWRDAQQKKSAEPKDQAR